MLSKQQIHQICSALFFLSTLFSPAFSQSNYEPGAIQTLSGERVNGFINYRNWNENPDKINFKEQPDGPRIQYSPNDIQAFSVKDEQYISARVAIETSAYKTSSLEYKAELNLDTVQVFLQTIFQGKKNLYHFRDHQNKDNFYIQVNDTLQLLIYKKYFKEEAKGKMIVENKTYIGQLKYYFRDWPSSRTKLDGIAYKKEALNKVFEDYYFHTLNKPEFKKEVEKVTVDMAVLTGVSISTLNFSSSTPSNVKFFNLPNTEFSHSANFTAGLSLDLVFPRTQKKLSFNTELLLTSYKVEGSYLEYTNSEYYSNLKTTIQSTYFKINTMFRYRFSNGIVQPFINAGISNGFALNIDRSQTVESVFYNKQSTEENTPLSRLKTYEFGLFGGLGLQYKMVSLELRYEHGSGISPYLNLGSTSSRAFVLVGYHFN